MAKIYTKTGDKGNTGLVDGSRISKASLRIEVLGGLDEANAELGLLVSWIAKGHPLRPLLLECQSWLFNCGSRLADPSETPSLQIELPNEGLIKRLESSIDAMTAELPSLTNFILPGGVEPAARAHIARAVVRRSERSIVALKESGAAVEQDMLRFLNRLSDWLFTAARYFNYKAGEVEVIWDPNRAE
jgi:cob(I)alamin adenosyltransferase